ncbi:MAG: hypothetical protein AAF567_13670 [Actinomycetota bacterium]
MAWPLTPQELHAIVEVYAGFGNHHTGTPADQATTTWLVDLLRSQGATVVNDAFEFDRFDCQAELRVDGEVVPSVPVFYSATGEFLTRDLAVVELPAEGSGNARGIDRPLADAPDADAVILALDGPDDLPVQCNRVPSRPGGSGRPAVIIPANWVERVRSGPADLAFSATVEPGRSANVIAAFGAPDSPEVNVTTPLTGWTPAAGERGTGLAAAIAMAIDLSADYSVTLSACSGHELDHLGLHHYLAARDVSERPAIHLGASVAATEPESTGPEQLGARRIVLTTATGELREVLTDRVRDANWTLVDAEAWGGEGGTWREAGASVLSFLGSSTVFHTTADTPQRATTPEALVLATDVAIDAARLFLAESDRPDG